MRYQERIYPQTNLSAVRNKEINVFNMSSDICVFNAPIYSISGTTKLNCTTLTGVSISDYTYIITGDTQNINFDVLFTGNTDTFTANTPNLIFKLYKYENQNFTAIPSYTSDKIALSAITNSATTLTIPASGLTLDNEYIIKSFYDFPACTHYFSKLGKTIDTSNFVGGDSYGIYNFNLDDYFVLVQQAATPIFTLNSSNNVGNGSLQQIYLPINFFTIFPDIDLLEEIDFEDENALANIEIDTMISIPVDIDTAFILTLNGLVLTEGLDYTYSGDSIVYFNAPLIPDDVVTLIYTANGVNPIKTDIYQIMTVIPSGATDEQGSFTVYYNTTTSKYEVFTSAKPLDFNSVLLMVNGAVLANGVDFYQSISNPRRIILNGDLVLNDIITINYFPDGVVGNLLTDLPTVSWFITPAPNKNNGLFTFELATDYNFNNIVYSATTDYVIDAQYYSLDYPVTGFEFGDRLFYRVRNDKNYETICGDIVNTFAYSDKIEITISTNTINSY